MIGFPFSQFELKDVMDPTKIYKIESYLTITPEELHMEYDFCGVFCFLV